MQDNLQFGAKAQMQECNMFHNVHLQAFVRCVQIMLDEGAHLEPFKVQLYEAKARDPKVPEGKAFAVVSGSQLGSIASKAASE